jgi:AcrR family transcriptional regulator
LDSSTKARLLQAADAEITERGVDAVHIETIARRAGVSRATAFRQLGSAGDVVIEVALLRATRNTAEVRKLMAKTTGTFAKMEAVFVHNARELPKDPAIAALIARHARTVHHPAVHAMAVDVMTPVLEEGRGCGDIRTDVTIDELVDYLVEQTYLTAEELDRSEAAVRTRFRKFIVPTIEAKGEMSGELASRIGAVEQSFAAVTQSIADCTERLHELKSAIEDGSRRRGRRR